MVPHGRPPWTRLRALAYLGQANLRGSRDNELASLAALYAPPRPRSTRATGQVSDQPVYPSAKTSERV